MPEPAPVTACTVVARDRLPAARVLARSYRAHHPDHAFVVFLVDTDTETRSAPGHRVVGVDWLKIDPDEYLRMATCCSASEFLDTVTPRVLQQLLDESEIAVYLDPQTQVLAPFAEVTALATDHDIVLAPRVLAPPPRDGRQPDDDTVPAGSFAREFLAVGQGARPFLEFWADRTRFGSIPIRPHDEPPARHWFDRVPAFFRHTVVRDPGVAVAYWNLHERALAARPDGTLTAAGSPLRLIHFAGFRPDKPWLLSADCVTHPRVRISENAELARLCAGYGEALRAAGNREADDAEPYGFGRLPDGTALTPQMRRVYQFALLETEQAKLGLVPFAVEHAEPPPHPFGDDAGVAFQRWLSVPGTPPERSAGLNRLTMWLWSSRTDLQVAFPHPLHGDAAAFRQWCRTHGVAENLVPDWALPIEPAPVAPPVDEFGVNVAGYLTAELGLGEMGRIAHRIAQHAGIPVVSVVEEKSLSRTVRTGLDAPGTASAPRFPVSILAVNSDYIRLLLDSHPEVGHQRYRIGLWAWELEDFPPHMHAGFALVDEVWTLSEFTRRAIAPHSPVPVKVIPLPVRDPGEPRRAERPPGDPVRFLFLFDFNSTGQRKNPWGVVTAFRRAFPAREDVRLVLKATNGHLHAPEVERLRHAIGGDRRIELLERYLSVEELDALYHGSDAYVSLHRSEGFGLTLAEAMVRGLPVISTDYSSTTEFVTTEVGWTIPYELTAVGPGAVPYHADGVWADPDLDAAAAAMRQVADDPALARRRGAAAREHLLRTRSMDAAATWMRAELERAYQTWRQRARTEGERAAPRPGPDALAPLDGARQALHWDADPTTPSRIPFAPTMRRLVRRAVDHYDVHLRRMMGALLDGMRDTAGRLDESSAAQERRLDALERNTNRRLSALAARLDRLESTRDRRRRSRRVSDEDGRSG